MIELMRFWFFSGFLLAGAAWSVDTLLRGKGVQLRGVWAAAMGLTVLSPILPRIGSFGGGIAKDEPLLAGVPAADFDVLAQFAAPLQTALVDGVVLAAWAIISVALLAFGATVLFRLNHRARTWTTAKVGGEEVLVAPDFGPAVVGLARPVIVLPEDLYRTRGSDLDLVLRHEREHVVARDPWLLLAGAAVVACMPWNLPLVWQATRLRAAVEEDCDIRVLRSGACRRSYADLLVRMASRSSSFGFAAAAMSERRSGLRRRLERLRNQEGQTRVAVTALLVIAGAGAIGVWTGMPSPVSFWGGHGLHAPAATTHVVPLSFLTPLPPAAPVAPAPPVFVDAEAMKSRHERVDRARLEATAVYQEALARLRAIEVDAGPIIYVNDEPFPGELADINPENIARVDVMKGEAARRLLGFAATGDIVNIYLKTDGTGSN